MDFGVLGIHSDRTSLIFVATTVLYFASFCPRKNAVRPKRLEHGLTLGQINPFPIYKKRYEKANNRRWENLPVLQNRSMYPKVIAV